MDESVFCFFNVKNRFLPTLIRILFEYSNTFVDEYSNPIFPANPSPNRDSPGPQLDIAQWRCDCHRANTSWAASDRRWDRLVPFSWSLKWNTTVQESINQSINNQLVKGAYISISMQLRDVTCLMGPHSATCHPIQVITPRRNPI